MGAEAMGVAHIRIEPNNKYPHCSQIEAHGVGFHTLKTKQY